MPYRDPEQARAHKIAYNAANRETINAKNRAYAAAHREEAVRRVAAWRLAHPGRRSASHRTYVAAHRDEVAARRAAQTAAQAAAHPGHSWARKKAWNEAHPDRAYEHARRGKAKYRGAALCSHESCLVIGPIALAWQINPHVCYLCGVPVFKGGNLQMDHVIPVARGGIHCAENLRPACQPCNHRKRAKMPDQVTALKPASR